MRERERETDRQTDRQTDRDRGGEEETTGREENKAYQADDASFSIKRECHSGTLWCRSVPFVNVYSYFT